MLTDERILWTSSSEGFQKCQEFERNQFDSPIDVSSSVFFLKNGKYLSKSELENMYQKKNMNLENRKIELKSGIGASLRSSNV